VKLFVPGGYNPATPAPLVVLLHGFMASGQLQEFLFHLEPEANARGALYAHPDGNFDKDGHRFWNATDVCCDIYDTKVDDVAYITSLLDEIAGRYNVDPKRIYFIGHSNGGFMSFRMSCDRSDRVAAMVSVAGGMWGDVSRCQPSEPVAVLHIHGTKDEAVTYEGEPGPPRLPSAEEAVKDWAVLDGCSPDPEANVAPMDIDGDQAGAETLVTRYTTGCKPGGHAELWTVQGAGHVLGFDNQFPKRVFDFFLAHPKP
jgi:polyhydroxybutyrate depolymerase